MPHDVFEEGEYALLGSDGTVGGPGGSPLTSSVENVIGGLVAGRGPAQGAAYVDAYGADPTGTNDSTAAFIAARDALPYITVYPTQNTKTGTGIKYPVGTIRLGSSANTVGYKIGSQTTTTTTTTSDIVSACPATWTLASTAGFSNVYGGQFVVMTSWGWAVIGYTGVSGSTVTGCFFIRGAGWLAGQTNNAVVSGATVQLDIGNLGPYCSMQGTGKAGCFVSYYGSGDAIRAYNGVQVASGSGLFNLPGEASRFDGFTVQGGAYLTGSGTGISGQDVFCGPSAIGLHVGDTEGFEYSDLCSQFFAGGQLLTPTASLGTTSSSGGTFSAGTYNWAVTAFNESGETNLSNDVFTTLVANGSQVINWAAITGARGYNIYRYTSSPANGHLVATVTAGTTTYTDTGTATTTHRTQLLNVTGCNGVMFEDYIGWTENQCGRIISRINDVNVCFQSCATSNGTGSFEYSDLQFKIYHLQNQIAIAMVTQYGAAGAFFRHGSLKARINSATYTQAQSSGAVLALTNTSTGGTSGISYSHLEIVAELDGGDTYGPSTILFGTPYTGGPYVQECSGILSFIKSINANYTASNWAPSKGTSFTFAGIINGDSNLHPNTGVATHAVQGAIGYGQVPLSSSGGMQMNLGDIGYLTLSANTTWAPSNTMAGPQRKTIFITQAASGGPYTMTWPKPGSPTVAAPAVYWPSGTAPTQSTGASAVDKYVLETEDGIHWYGQQLANFS